MIVGGQTIIDYHSEPFDQGFKVGSRWSKAQTNKMAHKKQWQS